MSSKKKLWNLISPLRRGLLIRSKRNLRIYPEENLSVCNGNNWICTWHASIIHREDKAKSFSSAGIGVSPEHRDSIVRFLTFWSFHVDSLRITLKVPSLNIEMLHNYLTSFRYINITHEHAFRNPPAIEGQTISFT